MPFIERNKERDREKKKRKKGRHRKSTNNKSLSTKPRSAIIFFFCVRPLTCRSPNLFFPVVTPLELDFS